MKPVNVRYRLYNMFTMFTCVNCLPPDEVDGSQGRESETHVIPYYMPQSLVRKDLKVGCS